MLINVHDKTRMPIRPLWQLIFTFTFNKNACGHMTKDIIGQQLMKWNDFVQLNKKRELDLYGLDPQMAAVPVGKKGSVIDEMEFQLQLMCSWVVREESGEFKPRVELFKKHKIDFRLAEPMCAVFPEHAHKRNKAKGLAALKVAMGKNPEDYSDPNDPKKRPKFFTPN